MFATTPEQLDFLRFPLGAMNKDQTREIAQKFGLIVQDKPDSQDICFVPNGKYGDVVRRLRPGAIEAGDIVHLDGTVLGQHQGVIDYTIGQRRGLGIGGRKEADEDEGPLYVVGINAAEKQVIVGPKEALACETVYLNEMNWLAETQNERAVLVKLRNTGIAVPAMLSQDERGQAVLRLDAPQYGIARGQAGVIYDAEEPDWLIGGGWIAAAPTAVDAQAG